MALGNYDEAAKWAVQALVGLVEVSEVIATSHPYEVPHRLGSETFSLVSNFSSTGMPLLGLELH
jgi:hypothetical protein